MCKDIELNATVIDTLRYANRLKAAGVESGQAEAMSRAINDELTEGVATKADLDDAVVELKGEITKVDAKLDAVDAKWGGKFDAMDVKWGGKFDAMDVKWEGKFDAMDVKWEGKFDAMDAKWEGKFDAMDAKWDGRFDAVDGRFESMDVKFEALNDRFSTHSRYTFLVLALIAALGLYNAAAPHFVGRAPRAEPAPMSTVPTQASPVKPEPEQQTDVR